MKQQLFLKWSLGIALSVLPLVGGCLRGGSGAPPAVVSVSESPTDPALAYRPVGEDEEIAGSSQEGEISEAPVKMIDAEKPVPANIQPSGALAEIIRFADSGVDERVMLAYVTSAGSAFNLGPEEIIYLNDIGVSSSVITAMLEHDRLLRQSAVLPAPAPAFDEAAAAPPAYISAPEPAPAPAELEYSSYPPPQPVSVSSPDFYDALAPYGSWVDVQGYGRCWQPTVVAINRSWRPYCDRGHWEYTDCGWYWLSDYSWGWAPFHYGRWFQHANLGWCWTPDKIWGPSWVSWRYSDDYCGWAPLPPRACYTPTAGFTYYGRSVGFNFNFGLRSDCYTFVPFNRFHDRHLSRHALRNEETVRIYNKTVVSTRIISDHNRVINNGLTAERVAAATHREIRRATLRDVTPASGSGQRFERLESDGRTLAVYRPGARQEVGDRRGEMGGRSQSRGIGISQAQEPGARSPRLAASTPRTVIASPAVTRGSTLDTRASEVRSQSRGIGISQAQASGVRSQESGARRPTFAASEVRTPTTVAAAPLVTQRSTSDTRAHASEARGRNPGSSESTGTTRTAPLILTGRKDAARSQSSGQTGWRPLVSQPTPTTPTMSRPESSARASRWTISRSQDHPAQAAIHQQMEPVRLAPTARETAASPPRHSRAEESAAHRERPRYEAGRSAESAVAASAPRRVASMPSFLRSRAIRRPRRMRRQRRATLRPSATRRQRQAIRRRPATRRRPPNRMRRMSAMKLRRRLRTLRKTGPRRTGDRAREGERAAEESDGSDESDGFGLALWFSRACFQSCLIASSMSSWP